MSKPRLILVIPFVVTSGEREREVRSKPATQTYLDNYEAIFGKKKDTNTYSN